MEPVSVLAAVSVIVAVLGAAVEAFVASAGTVETSDASFADSASFDDPDAAASAAAMNLHLLAWSYHYVASYSLSCEITYY